jgi:hypothetical protein
MRAKPSLAFTSVLVALAALSSPAGAACKKFGFTVNDYGKDGPTNDAKNLLDKHISEWAAQSGVKEYQTGKKSVSCELFLDVILFDEHTCTASATVCWGDGVKPNNKTGQQSAAAETPAATEESGDHPPAPMRKAEAMGVAPQQAAAAAPAAEAAAPATAAAEEAPPAAPVAPVEQAAAPAGTPTAIPAVQHTTAPAAPTPPPTGAAVETGALQAGAGMAAQPAVNKPAAPGVPDKDRAAAAAAASSAAAAAERAAVAAETAANAAKEAAAAAVAASAASKGSASVPPLDHASTDGKPPHNE